MIHKAKTFIAVHPAFSRMVVLFCLCFCYCLCFSFPLLAQSEDYVLVDTAYIDPTHYIKNQSDTISVSGHTFKGPGPFTVHFRAEMAEQPEYCAWEIAEDNKFQTLIDRFRDVEPDGVTALLDYEFSEQGSYYIRFTADFLAENGDTVTYNTQKIYDVTISTSILEVPNVITPDSPSGQNQTFYVKYQSLVEYEIWIYNRWGNQLFHSKDPSEGWDGTYNGRTVPTGAYYYVIKAKGTDGQNYVKKGDINVLKTKRNNSK